MQRWPLQPRCSAVLGSQGPLTAQQPRAGPTGGLGHGRPRAQRERGKSRDPREPLRPSPAERSPGAPGGRPTARGGCGGSAILHRAEQTPRGPTPAIAVTAPPRSAVRDGPGLGPPAAGLVLARPRPPPRPAQVSGETGRECGRRGGGWSAVRGWLRVVRCACCCCCSVRFWEPLPLQVSGAA